MNANPIITDTRTVSGFERVILKAQHENELIITQGDREALTIQGPSDILPRIDTVVRQGTLIISMGGGWLEKIGDALSTSFTRARIQYNLTVKTLSYLEVYALASVQSTGLKAGHLALKFNGAGELRIDPIDAESLEVSLSGAGTVDLGGHVLEQKVTINGPCRYEAPRLKSQKAKVTLRGIGTATVRATRDLEVTMRGPGRVAYYGTPQIRTSISPLGSLSRLGDD